MSHSPPSPPSPRQQRSCILVCQHRSCLRNGAASVLEAFRSHGEDNFSLLESDCMGQCSAGPNVQVLPKTIWYCRVKAEDVPEIIEQHRQGGDPVKRLLHPRFHPQQFF